MKKGQPRQYKKKSNISFFERHRSAFSFISAFLCCTAIFGAVAAVVLFSADPVFNTLSGSSGIFSASSSQVSYPASDTFNMLICIHSDSDGYPVEFMLYRLDTVKNETVVMPVPLELSVTSQDTVCTLSKLYKISGISGVENALSELLSVKINYTCSIGSGNFLKLFNIFGGLYGVVPENINFTMPDGSGKIALTASQKQYLGGSKLYALIACSSYRGGNTVRYEEQSALMKEFLAEKLKGYYLKNADAYYGNAFNHVSTDFSMINLLNYMDAMKTLSAQNSIETPSPQYSSVGTGLLQIENTGSVRKYFS